MPPYNELKLPKLACRLKMKFSFDKNVDTFVVIFFLLSILLSSLALANVKTPEGKVKAIFFQVENSLATLKNNNQLTSSHVRVELNKYLLPEVNTLYFTKKVLNKNLSKVSEELKSEFVSELSTQLITTFSHLLSKYNGESIVVGESKMSKSEKIAMINISIKGKGKTNKAIVKLIKSTDDIWLFYDIVIEGISLLDSKQKEISSSFNKLGAEGTLLHLKDINRRSSTSS